MTLPNKELQRAHLAINSFELPVHLGWLEAERQQAQTIRIDLLINFSSVPKACKTDQLQDTFCYDQLLQSLQQNIAKRQFRLIEHLAKEIHIILRSMLPHDTQLTVKVLKFPAISGLTGGVTFTYCD